MIDVNSVIYHLITDRFDNEKGDLHKVVDQKDYNSRFRSYLGGTFNGIRNRASHLEELGVTHVLISPVCDCREYHGYTAEESMRVNPRFGTEEDLSQMVKELDKRGIGTVLDYVATHMSFTNPVFLRKFGSKRGKDWFIHPGLETQEKYRAYFDEIAYKSTQGHPEKLAEINHAKGYLGFFGLEHSPLVNLMNPQVVAFNRRVLDYWIDHFGFSDVRFDSAYIQPRQFISSMKRHLKRKHPNVSLIAENWDFQIDNGRTLGFSSGEIDIKGVFLFNEMKTNPNFFREVRDHFMRTKDLVKLDFSSVLSLGNHDMRRFNAGADLQKIAAAIQFTLPETPLIYYGQEIPMVQYNDGTDGMGQSRDPMRFDLLPSQMFEFYKKLAGFRRSHDFRRAEISAMNVSADNNLISYRIGLGEESYYFIANRGENAESVIPAALFKGDSVSDLNILENQRLRAEQDKFLIEAKSCCLLGKK